LKPGLMKFWLCLSLAMALLASWNLAAREESQNPARAGAHPANETVLAGLRPGRDTFAMAEKRFKAKNLSEDKESGVEEWSDGCSGRAIRLELDAQSVIQSVTITSLGDREGKCSEKRLDFLDPKNWVTGLGLHIGDSQDQIVALYGEPDSSGPATKNGHELVLMYYQFDWAGSDVPQVMEVLCARDSGRVVEITLAYPSL
jgi:hypothetical protein